MQSEKTKIQELHSNILAIYKTILECFLKRDVLLKTPLHEINIKDQNNYLPLSELYLGAQIGLIRSRNLFFIEAASQISNRFDFNNVILKILVLIKPDINKSGEYNSIIPLAKSFLIWSKKINYNN